MTSINSPQLIWIQGRCHRINPTTDKTNIDIQSKDMEPRAYEEPDNWFDQEDNSEIDILLINNKFVSSLHVPW